MAKNRKKGTNNRKKGGKKEVQYKQPKQLDIQDGTESVTESCDTQNESSLDTASGAEALVDDAAHVAGSAESCTSEENEKQINEAPLDKQPRQLEEPHIPDPSLLEPQAYINSIPGKDVRGTLIDCFQLWFKVERLDVLTTVKDIVTDLHNASLLIDDIEDSSKLRRGQPVAHSIFGVPSVINCANYVFFLALGKCQSLKNEKAMKIFISEMLNLHRGQGYDITWRDQARCPTEEQYCEMVIDKTGGLFRLTVGLMQSFATLAKDKDFTPLLNSLGLYFQIRDDLINLADENYFKSKSFCEDLTEGKFSYPIIHCIRHHGEADTRLLSILKQRTEDSNVKLYAQNLMKKSGSLKYARDKCITLKKEIVLQIEELGGNPALKKLIEKLDIQVAGLENAVVQDNIFNELATL